MSGDLDSRLRCVEKDTALFHQDIKGMHEKLDQHNVKLDSIYKKMDNFISIAIEEKAVRHGLEKDIRRLDCSVTWAQRGTIAALLSALGMWFNKKIGG